MAEKKQQKKWIRPRHRVVQAILRPIFSVYARIKYGIRVEPFRQQEDRPYLVLMNHQTDFDQFFVGMAIKGPVYYLATEDIFSLGWVSTVLRFLVAPIPIKKQTTDLQAVMNCMRVVREGGTLALFPEGNRTYSGKTEYMNPAIGKLAKRLKLPIVLLHAEDGYGIQPRWSDTVRRGKMRVFVHQVIEPETYRDLSEDELMTMIRDGLYVDDGKVTGTFIHKNPAQYLERAMYVCPFCGLSTFESHGDIITCQKCSRRIRYTPTKELKGVDFDFPFPFVTKWYDYQCDFVNDLDLAEYYDTPMYRDTARLSQVIIGKRKELLDKEASVTLYGNRIEISGSKDYVFPFDEASAVTVLGRNKVNIYHDKQVYQLKGSKRFNALKYVNMYYRYQNITKEDGNGKFLGL